jgi:hypothetical protein
VADRRFSAETLSLLGAPETNPTDSRHGYELSKETGLRSGTLYPMLTAGRTAIAIGVAATERPRGVA